MGQTGSEQYWHLIQQGKYVNVLIFLSEKFANSELREKTCRKYFEEMFWIRTKETEKKLENKNVRKLSDIADMTEDVLV